MFVSRHKRDVFGTSTKVKLMEPPPVVKEIQGGKSNTLNLPVDDPDSEDEIAYLPGERLLLQINKDARKRKKKEKPKPEPKIEGDMPKKMSLEEKLVRIKELRAKLRA